MVVPREESAFSQMTVVVPAAGMSGSLHTAEAALLRGRTVAAVPGPINDPVSEGSNALIADGALAIISTGSLGEALGFDQPLQSVSPPAEQVVTWRLVTNGGLADELSSGGPRSAQVMSDLTRLELLGMIERLPGGGWVPIGHGGGSVGSI
ncbi:MAG: DNA-processing protein DprA, partial [Solirubrobacterales bacterium]|nr:DNA-processing protein DprA [Solirubrobacterales bacterium]